MRCFVQTHLSISPETAWALVKKPATLVHVARGFLKFSEAGRFPKEWAQGQKLQTRLWFFHIIPGWWQHCLEAAEVNDTQRVIRSHESGFCYTWDHTIRITEAPTGCGYSDEINIHAGLLTVFVWLYANIFYRYRQVRWRRLASQSGKG